MPLDILEPIAAALETTPAYLMGWDYKQEPEELADVTAQILLNPETLAMVEDYLQLSEADQYAVRMMVASLAAKNKKG